LTGVYRPDSRKSSSNAPATNKKPAPMKRGRADAGLTKAVEKRLIYLQ
jgi:hypothetical protein